MSKPAPPSAPTPARKTPTAAAATFDPLEVPLGGVALDRWTRHFGIDLRRMVTTLREGPHLQTFRVADGADLERVPNLGPGARAPRETFRRVAVEVLREHARLAGPRLERRAAFARRRAAPDNSDLRTALEGLRSTLHLLPPPAPGTEDEPLFRYPDRDVRFKVKPPALEIGGDHGAGFVVDIDRRTVHQWGLHGPEAHGDDRRAALMCAIDAMCDPEGEARRAMEAWAATPRWQHALDDLDAILQSRRAPAPKGSTDRLAFRLAPGELVLPRIVLQSPRKGGGFTAGRSAKLTEARRLVVLDALEAEILDLYATLLTAAEDAVERPLFARLLGLLGRHPRVFVEGDLQTPVQIVRARPRLVAEPVGDAYRLDLHLGEHSITQVGARTGRLLGHAPPGSGLYLFAVLDDVSAAVLDTVGAATGVLPARGVDALFRAMNAHEHVQLELELPPALRGEQVVTAPRTLVRLALRAGATLDATIRVRPWPQGPLLTPGQGPHAVHGVAPDGGRTFAVRDRAAELARAFAVVNALGEGLEPGGDFTVAIEEPDRACEAIVALAELGDQVEVEWEGPSLLVSQTAAPSALRLRVTKRRDWFGVEGGLEVEGEQVSLATLLEATRAGRRFVRLKHGKLLAIGRELRERLARADDLLVPDHGQLTIGAHGVERLAELVDDESQLDAAREWVALRERWRAARTFEPALPAGLRADLRPYQVAGFAWLARLAACGVSGCLADDMGLGKTVQALALLVERAAAGPALVVAPTSVGPNWEVEASRFAPGLRVAQYRGAGRADRLAALEPGDVLVVSYDLLVRDVEALAAVRFATLVFDEAHAMKNPVSKRAMAARRLEGDFRLALTGTPIENHLGELWSLFRVLMPALLGSWDRFRERFAGPIEADRDPARRAALAALVRPYLLRRTKDEVAPELPPRTEIVRFVELSADERALYEAERRAAVEALARKKDDEGARFAVFSALLRLRQLACHPRLRDPGSPVASSKLASAVELLEELKETGHRALVFSQFTSHLALVGEALRALGFSLVELDGSTPAEARAARVRSFQAGEADVFLISLKAGGVGLNLTAADTVLHLDPWWNPAAEDQASDRAHRIGQTRPVTVVRLIARQTIEETVLALHADKRELADAVLAGGDGGGKLSTADLVALMETADPQAPPVRTSRRSRG